ncbi:hypothetical protein HLB35_15810 [Halomonas sp. TBZ9]|uniref:Abi-like protein n=1 Tax=Vreelandella azerica TaxID=2732867 RepID=A0A7Y3TZ21_9GAMM|nr:hypothetical protein [Halomonas azerica]
MSTYDSAISSQEGDDLAALELYIWNAQISGVFLAPLHLCEVVMRNAVSEALEAKYGVHWPWSPGFEQSLPAPPVGYSPRRDLFNARQGAQTVGKVIPELKFAFWQRMFTKRHDHRLWNTLLFRVFPGLPTMSPTSELRKEIFEELEKIRTLRNRIAHHEPIFTRNLQEDFERIVNLVAYRSQPTASWLKSHQQVEDFIGSRPAIHIIGS